MFPDKNLLVEALGLKIKTIHPATSFSRIPGRAADVEQRQEAFTEFLLSTLMDGLLVGVECGENEIEAGGGYLWAVKDNQPGARA